MATNLDLTQLGLAYQSAGKAINDRISDDFNDLDFHQVQELSNKAQDLFIKSKSLFALATISLQDDAKASLQSLSDASDKLNKAIAKLARIQKIVNIATDLVSIAGDVLSADFKEIPGSVKSLLADISAKPGE
ncbi:hypothetical protein [Puia sp.]|jgi:signal transduction histidine kinase|uniref:hypothetical protein n=1 Tax=Puia sp. TaxID=2045100 RepID=UPI002F3ED5AD